MFTCASKSSSNDTILVSVSECERDTECATTTKNTYCLYQTYRNIQPQAKVNKPIEYRKKTTLVQEQNKHSKHTHTVDRYFSPLVVL